MLLVVTTKNEYCEEVNFEQTPDKAKVFETEKNLHFLKNSTAARMARINWAAREDVENEVWEEKKKQKTVNSGITSKPHCNTDEGVWIFSTPENHLTLFSLSVSKPLRPK